MPRGGKRNGAGRKRGSATKKTVEIATAAHERGVSPLEVMLDVMERHYKAKRYDEAAAVARDAAPFMHARLSSVQQEVRYPDGVPVTVQDLREGRDEAEEFRRNRLAGATPGTNGHAASNGAPAGHPP